MTSGAKSSHSSPRALTRESFARKKHCQIQRYPLQCKSPSPLRDALSYPGNDTETTDANSKQALWGESRTLTAPPLSPGHDLMNGDAQSSPHPRLPVWPSQNLAYCSDLDAATGRRYGHHYALQAIPSLRQCRARGDSRQLGRGSGGNNKNDGNREGDDSDESDGIAYASDVADAKQSVCWACPFYRRDSTRYDGCMQKQLRRMGDVKQHLARRHRQPLHCPTCGEIFSHPRDRDGHIIARLCGPPPGGFEIDGYDEEQGLALARRVSRSLNEVDQWFSIYQILFPGSPRPSSPYVQGHREETVGMIRDYMGRHGSRLALEATRASLGYAENMHLVSNESIASILENLVGNLLSQFLASSRAATKPTSSCSRTTVAESDLICHPVSLLESNAISPRCRRSTTNSATGCSANSIDQAFDLGHDLSAASHDGRLIWDSNTPDSASRQISIGNDLEYLCSPQQTTYYSSNVDSETSHEFGLPLLSTDYPVAGHAQANVFPHTGTAGTSTDISGLDTGGSSVESWPMIHIGAWEEYGGSLEEPWLVSGGIALSP